MAFRAVMNCPDCGVEYIAKAPGAQRCRPCAKVRRRVKLKAYAEKSLKTSKRHGRRICRKCNVSKPKSAYSVLVTGRVTCDECKALPPVKPFVLPSQWKVAYQHAPAGMLREIQQVAPSVCYTCIKLKSCRAQVHRTDYVLPCFKKDV